MFTISLPTGREKRKGEKVEKRRKGRMQEEGRKGNEEGREELMKWKMKNSV